jgi:hypothetical protein
MDPAARAGEPSTMDSERPEERAAAWWIVQVPTPALVKRAVRDIDSRSQGERDILLSRMLCTAWPAPRSQLQ